MTLSGSAVYAGLRVESRMTLTRGRNGLITAEISRELVVHIEPHELVDSATLAGILKTRISGISGISAAQGLGLTEGEVERLSRETASTALME